MFDEDCENVRKEKAETFHKLVVNMLFATKIARLYTGKEISYLTTSVRELEQSNWLNMVHLFKYVICPEYLPLIMSEEKSRMLKWYIDVSYDVNPNMRGNTGGGLKMRR